MTGRIKFSAQYDIADCGPTCLKMITEYYGKHFSLEYLREICFLGRDGVSLLNVNDAAEKLGFRTYMAALDMDKLVQDCPLPAILHWNQDHFVILYKIKKGNKFVIADPAHGIVELDEETFVRAWISHVENKGIILLLEPTPEFYKNKLTEDKKAGYGLIFRYLKPYRRYLAQIIFGMMMASVISFLFPYITKLLIDEGVSKKNISVVYLVLFSQFFLFIGSTVIEILRNWLLLHVNARLSLNIISDFLAKLLKLPISFFDSKAVGDLSQRISDHHRVDTFLTGTVISSIFSIINIFISSIILSFYSLLIFSSFLVLSAVGVVWILLFQKKRKQLDYKRFARNRENQDKLYELITGMQEIKLYASETTKRWEWERLQIRFFKLNIKTLALEQWQNTGFGFFSTLKNIIISYFAANAVIEGSISLGTLLSISYIIGQTNGPIAQLVSFIQSAQDARLSMDRLQEIHMKKNEDEREFVDQKIFDIPHTDIDVDNVSFQYEGPNSAFVLKNVSFKIPKGKVTAIVGTSGSGKTTLMKLLLGFYSPVSGQITVDNKDLHKIPMKLWRSQCSSVMQDGYIFYDTIAKNIALDGKPIDETRMEQSVKIAHVEDVINSLPLKYTTKIGASGVGLSGGQRQRILIARAVYKDPSYLFFDEATSSLDSNNEKQIIDNLNQFFLGRTVLIIAHRLSTVKNADQIIVLEEGEVVEQGNHQQLIAKKGKYYELVKNQLELGI